MRPPYHDRYNKSSNYSSYNEDNSKKKPAPQLNGCSSEYRGIFGEDGDSSDWLKACEKFPNKVPRFDSKEECLKFMKEYVKNHGGSNPDFAHLQHIFTTLITWDQIEHILLPAINKARTEKSLTCEKEINNDDNDASTSNINIFEQSDAAKIVIDGINARLNLPFHQVTTPVSVLNTMRYLFFHMKCGIYVMIRNHKVRIFCPFSNRDYENTWSGKLRIEGDDANDGNNNLNSYYQNKVRSLRGKYREENIVKDMNAWWANGSIICNEITPNRNETKYDTQVWGDQFLAPLRDMLEEACNKRPNIPDCEFFLNKRDYPQLKVNVEQGNGGIPVEPYGFIFDKDDLDPNQDVELAKEHKFNTYAPIVSFYAGDEKRFADLPFPSSEDWEGACGYVFPHTFTYKRIDRDGYPLFKPPRDLFTEKNFLNFEQKWEDKVNTAFFRGTATGGGTTIDNNQRLKLAHLSHTWKKTENDDIPTSLDAAIVGWNLRDKKIANSPMTYLRPRDFEFTAGRHHFTPIYEQSKYKYLVYVDGHCAACRYGFMMRLGSVILKVASQQVADRMWYFPLLQPYIDHVPIKKDLSDLKEKIDWCRDNDDKCREIAQNCKKLYDTYVSKNGLLDYIEVVMKQIAQRQFKGIPTWWEVPEPELLPPELCKPKSKCGGKSLRVQRQRDEDEEHKYTRRPVQRQRDEDEEHKYTCRPRKQQRRRRYSR
mmetsp:Transcript_9767/g.10855  ORF Transcript_9767/g.10855 Transcript_9767/m.10855 type:complete len:709 (+) Transcript_9767:45-2171(+)